MVFKSLIGATCTCLAVASFSADAALASRLVSLAVYDTDSDITWRSDTNAGAGSEFDNEGSTTDGMMNYLNAELWVASLTFGGVLDWWLPTTSTPDAGCTIGTNFGFNCTAVKMGHLFNNEFNGVAGNLVLNSADSDLALFDFVQIANYYWSSSKIAGSAKYIFNYGDCMQNGFGIGRTYYAWAVPHGDIGVVPIPAAVWLFGSGLIGLIGVARRKKA